MAKPDHSQKFLNAPAFGRQRSKAVRACLDNANRLVDLRASNPWNVPAWRDANAYPKTDAKPVGYWRWEFLRRDIIYRKLWCEYQQNQKNWGRPNGNEPSRSEAEARKFCLDRMISPACPFNILVSIALEEACPVELPTPDGISAVSSLARQKGHLVTAINPYECLESQFEKIRQSVNLLKSEYFQEDFRWPPRDKWPLYLRMLDARDDRRKYADLKKLGLKPEDYNVPSFEQIAGVLKSELQPFAVTRQSISKQYKAAVKAQQKFTSWIPVEPKK